MDDEFMTEEPLQLLAHQFLFCGGAFTQNSKSEVLSQEYFWTKFEGAWTSWTNVDEDMKDVWFHALKNALFKEMYETQMTERQLQSGESSSHQSIEESANNIFLEVVGGIHKKGRIFELGSQAANVRPSSKSMPYISTDLVSSDKVTAMEAQIQALTTQLNKRILNMKSYNKR